MPAVGERRGLGAPGEVDAVRGGQGRHRGVKRLEVHVLERGSLVGQAGELVFARDAGHLHGLGHERREGRRREVARVDVGGAAAHEYAQAQAAAARIGEGLHLAAAHGHREVRALEQQYVGLVGPAGAGLAQHLLRLRLQVHGRRILARDFRPWFV